MEKYIPDIYQKSIYTIDYQKLIKRGIKCILFSLDNTMVSVNTKDVSRKLKDLFDDLKTMGFDIVIFTNNTKKRVSKIKEILDVDCCPHAKKPNVKKFNMILEQKRYKESEVCIIGDLILTDILGGNRAGITTILVNPISKKNVFFTNILRFREKGIIDELRDKNLFVKGRYYD